jgi:MFS family permease
MLKYLNFNYVTFTVISLSPVIFFILFSPIVGKFSDKFGNVKLLYLAGFLFPIVPLLWIFIESPLYLILFPSLISGLANAAFILAINDFTYDAVSVQRRGLCVAYTSLLTGIGIFLGSIIGGLIIEYLPINFMEPILFSFLVSSLLILMVSLFFLPQLKEVRKTEEISLSADLSHPFKTIHSDIVWFKNFLHNGKKSKV